MPSNCSVYGCFNTKSKTKGSGVKYFSFPKETPYRDLWINACRRADKVNPENAVICSVHFKPQDHAGDMKSRLLGIESPARLRTLRKDAVPSLLLQNEKASRPTTPTWTASAYLQKRKSPAESRRHLGRRCRHQRTEVGGLESLR